MRIKPMKMERMVINGLLLELFMQNVRK